MQKRGILFVFLFSLITLMAMNFVSAAFHYGGYSLSDLLSSFDSSTVILTVIFIIAFSLIFFALSKFFRENTTIAGIISVAMSLLLIFGINRRGYDFSGFFYNIGISEGILYTIAPLVLLIGLIFSGFKYGWGITLTSIGGFLIFITVFTDIIYEGSKGITFILGAILLGVGIWLWRRKKKDYLVSSNSRDYYDNSYRPNSRQIYKQQRTQQNLGNKKRQKKVIIQQQRQQIQQRQRTQRELQGKYNQYRYAAESICKRVGHIPKKGAPEYREWKGYTKAVKTIEKMASKQGFRLR